MDGAPRSAWQSAVETLAGYQRAGGPDLRSLAGELFSVSELLADNAKLRMALTDRSRDAWSKRELARRLFGGRLSEPALAVVEAAVSGHWKESYNLVTGMERLGGDCVLAAAQTEGNLDQIERELIAVEEKFRQDHQIGAALSEDRGDKHAKAELVARLLAGKVLPDTVWIAQRPVLNPRGYDYATVIRRYLSLAAKRRQAVTAVVTTRTLLPQTAVSRLQAGLSKMYGTTIFVTQVEDPQLLGGLRIQVGDEVIDGTIERRLADVSRTLSVS
ncbi:F0F1 ATP synthase subunit delta [Dermatophilus congolensis]|uniref:ATP synthase subunit delta n=1 Tax=Dermatophilus congolensis TaxID=1863 RepID=A0A239VEX7_9MICO|nr:F0F1 ATP synthase subunit delta [Dermatophilus congolensis]MBO3128716.1 F0F1 ATP synthase subunit delta [Dermatophilus congolensis]MBO3132647.1 F0F1 ATP synthase subunit delta [Dermatophilus congolensis]MBO3133192.1 F0F1 ATP synthase subunit delta [Dermatophilus congolensis]MBO3135427.1 F0F1 ATP synthase subunit delta [Dermatophilus congolensis]MBO3137667.1 F0F1 ATP synthase subunit delta [Dermatophilus congolensis]